MSLWLVLLLGIVIGWIIGVVIVRQNHETCKKHIAALKAELASTEQQLGEAEHMLEGIATKARSADG